MVRNSKMTPMGQKLGQKIGDAVMPVNKTLRDINQQRQPAPQPSRMSQRNDAANMRAEVARVQARRAMDNPTKRTVDPDESLTRPKTKAKAKGGMLKASAKKPMMKKPMMKKPMKKR